MPWDAVIEKVNGRGQDHGHGDGEARNGTCQQAGNGTGAHQQQRMNGGDFGESGEDVFHVRWSLWLYRMEKISPSGKITRRPKVNKVHMKPMDTVA